LEAACASGKSASNTSAAASAALAGLSAEGCLLGEILTRASELTWVWELRTTKAGQNLRSLAVHTPRLRLSWYPDGLLWQASLGLLPGGLAEHLVQNFRIFGLSSRAEGIFFAPQTLTTKPFERNPDPSSQKYIALPKAEATIPPALRKKQTPQLASPNNSAKMATIDRVYRMSRGTLSVLLLTLALGGLIGYRYYYFATIDQSAITPPPAQCEAGACA
jgi:hypothetical protein